jgi:hypothetical protein
MRITDHIYIETRDKDNNLIANCDAICFALFNREDNSKRFFTEGANTLSIYFGHYTTKTTTKKFLAMLVKSKLIDKTYLLIIIRKKVTNLVSVLLS